MTKAQRQFLRMGPRNMRIVKAKLRAFAGYLGIPDSALPPRDAESAGWTKIYGTNDGAATVSREAQQAIVRDELLELLRASGRANETALTPNQRRVR